MSGHRQRLRQRAERDGWNALRPHEMVELVLYYAVPRRDLSEISRVLVDRFGSVGGVFHASKEALEEVTGVTPAMAEWLTLTGEVMNAYYDLYAERDIRLICYQDVLRFLSPRVSLLTGYPLWVLYADFDFNLMMLSPVKGDMPWSNADDVRRVVKDAITLGARYIYLVRCVNGLRASLNEEEITRMEAVTATLRAVDVELVDCILLGSDGFHSMNNDGGLERIHEAAGHLALYENYRGKDEE